MAGTQGALHLFDNYITTNQGPNGQYTDNFYTSNPGGENLGAYSFVSSNVWSLFQGATVNGIVGTGGVIYRFYNFTRFNHLFKFGSNTPNAEWNLEGPVGWAYNSSGANRYAVYRFFNPTLQDHKYTTSASTPSGYIYEGVAWYSPIPVYGCKDSSANNYNAYANQPDPSNSYCTYNIVGCTDPRASNYNPSANTNSGCIYPTPNITFNTSTLFITDANPSATLDWSITNSTAQTLNGTGINTTGTLVVTPSSTFTTYRISANYYGITFDTKAITIRKYIKPIINMSVENSPTARGNSVKFTWFVTGDASTFTANNGIGGLNLSGFIYVSPTVTTTYLFTATGLGGTTTLEATAVILPPPGVSLTGPVSVNYGSNIILQHSQQDATVSYNLIATLTDLDNVVTTETIDLGPSASVSDTYTYIPTYTNRGPFSIQFALYGVGAGSLSDMDDIVVSITIDQEPNSITIPASENKDKDESPVITPDVEVTTTPIVVEDIDIPVEIKSDAPIQVDIDNQDNFLNIREM